MVLVCFALKEEAAPFRARAPGLPRVRILVTGMGARNTGRAVAPVLTEAFSQVFTCGFAGGLNPGLELGDVVFSPDTNSPLESKLRAGGAKPGRFHFSNRIASTASEKAELWRTTGADAVEMESQVIHDLCRAQNVPCATVRVISDTAHDDMPLDFNLLQTADQALHPGKLAAALLRSPGKIPALLELRKRTVAAAERLAAVLAGVLQ